MKPNNHIAFKEWAVVCGALGSGQQSLILRKGGIHEGREGFRVAHREFWLYPTAFHQEPASVTGAAQTLLQKGKDEAPPDHQIHLRQYVEVEQVKQIQDEGLLPRLRSWHVWSDETVRQRFHYKTPGLFAMAVRIWQRTEALVVPFSSHYAGCRSWVDFPIELSTEGLSPVISDEQHAERMQELSSILQLSSSA